MQTAPSIQSVPDPDLEVAGPGSASHPWIELGMELGMELRMDPRMEMEARMQLGIQEETAPLIYSTISGV